MNKIFQILLLFLFLASCDDDYQDVKVYYETGEIKAEGVMYKGYEHGPWVRYYKNGKKESEGSFYFGTQVSDWYWYYDNGQIEDSVYFDRGDEQGLGVSYYKNGSKKAYGQWNLGYKFGIWRYFNKDGVLMMKGEFNEYGYRDGKWLIKDSLGLNDSIFIYSYGFVDTAYALELDTINLDSIDVQPFELKGNDIQDTEEIPYSENQG